MTNYVGRLKKIEDQLKVRSAHNKGLENENLKKAVETLSESLHKALLSDDLKSARLGNEHSSGLGLICYPSFGDKLNHLVSNIAKGAVSDDDQIALDSLPKWALDAMGESAESYVIMINGILNRY